MDILGIGPLELLLILLIALIVVGPKDLGKLARSFGRFLNRLYRSDFWRTMTETSQQIRTLPNRLAREAALEELDQVRADIGDLESDTREHLEGVQEGLKAWTPPQDKNQEPGEDASEEPPMQTAPPDP
jgi:sec-independent protein translocase protein TatB